MTREPLRESVKQAIVVGILSMLALSAVVALIITYWAYLPTITSFIWHKSDAEVVQYSYQIACTSFFIAGVSGVILGFALPIIFRSFRRRYGKRAV